MDTQKLKGHGAMLCANAMWGLMSPLAKFVMAGGLVSSLVVTDLRVFGAMLLFWIVSFFRKPEHVGHKDLAKLFVASLLAIVFNQGCFIFGVGLTSPADASIITTSMPLWAMVLAAIFLKEPITGKKVLGIAFGAGGALLLIMGSSHSGAAASNPYSLWGDLLAAGWESLSWAEIGSLLFIVVGGTFLCYIFVVVGQKYLRPTVAGMYNYVQPVVACIVAICWGMDTFNWVKVLSVLLIFGGVYMVTMSRSRAEMEAHAREAEGARR